MTTLVTGVAGFIGFHLANRLIKEGERVIGIDNLNNYYDPLLKNARLKFLKSFREESFSFEKINLEDKELVLKIFENYNKGLADSKKYLDKLLKLLRENSIGINFVLYPHPSQIYYKDLYHLPYWEKWAKKNKVKMISLYPDFDGNDKRRIILDT